MNKIEHCKKCKKRQLDLNQGVVCSLTKEKPAFIDFCQDFVLDDTMREDKNLDLKPNKQRAKLLLALIWTVLFLEIVSLISNGLQYNLIQTAANGGEITDSASTANDLRVLILAILYLVAYISSGFAFIMWLRRAYYNLHQKVKSLSFTEGWAAGSWFIPFVNLYRPYQIIKEIYVETKKHITTQDESIQIHLNTRYLGLWWTLWIINIVLGQLIFRLSRNAAETLPELLTSTTLDIISGLVGIPLALITIKVIKDYSSVEELLSHRNNIISSLYNPK